MNFLSLFVFPCLLCYVTAKYQCLNEDNIEKEWQVLESRLFHCFGGFGFG